MASISQGTTTINAKNDIKNDEIELEIRESDPKLASSRYNFIERKTLIKENMTSDGNIVNKRLEFKQNKYEMSFFFRIVALCGDCIMWTIDSLKECCSPEVMQVIGYPAPGFDAVPISNLMNRQPRNHYD